MTKLRVAVVHSFYSEAQPSGENEAVRDQIGALRRAGHDVRVVAAHTDRMSGSRVYPLQAAATVALDRGRSPAGALRAFAPDVVHVHNLFPNFTRGWARDWGGPLVATLHNFRPLCAGSTLYRAGETCTRCLDGDRWAGLRNGCYRDSRAATAPLAWAGRHGATNDPLLRAAHRLVVLSAFGSRFYQRAGIAAERTTLIPNFVAAPAAPPSEGPGSGWVFAGRLTAEKGVLELVARWPDDEPLDIVGDGELAAAVRAAAPPSVRFMGPLDRDELRRRLPSWRGLVFPSRCFEGAPLIQVEAHAAGLPILAFEGSSVAESVRAHGTGAVVRWDEPLRPALHAAAAAFPAQRARCREVFADLFTESAWLRRTEQLYREVLASG